MKPGIRRPGISDEDSGIYNRIDPRGSSPLTGSAADFDPLMKLIGNANVVMIGEASHGTR